VLIDGRRSAAARAELTRVIRHAGGEDALLTVSVKEGRNRQVRRMCDAIGHPVARLKRIGVGPLRDDSLKPGQFRFLTDDELSLLRRAAATSAGREPRRSPSRS
jgi:pseudouridine synthase